MSTIQEKASKWDSLIKWIKATASDDDSDVWEKLEELGVNASGGEEEEEYECEECSVKVKTEKDLTITYGCMDMKFCEDCYKTSKEEEEDRLCPCGDGYKESGCPDGCGGGCCISCCGVGEEKEFECYKCENTHDKKMFSRWEKGFVEEEPNAICKDCEEEEVCCGGCNGEICDDCPVDNTSNRYFKCSGCKKYSIEDEDDYKEGYISTICHSCMFGTGDPNQVYKKELAGI